MFTYIFTLLALRFIYKNYMRFIRSRQLFSLELVHSIPARTVMVTNLPAHLQSERALAEYYENMDLAVESVSLCREVAGLKDLLDRRTEVLMKLESAWVNYVGNPSTVESYDPSDSVMPEQDLSHAESQRGRLVVPHRSRPTMRLGWFKSKVDAIEHLDNQFTEADDAVKRKRRTGKFKPTHVAFVTFEKMSSAVGLFSPFSLALRLPV
jgi:calcium permeable stress-gated cation channel